MAESANTIAAVVTEAAVVKAGLAYTAMVGIVQKIAARLVLLGDGTLGAQHGRGRQLVIVGLVWVARVAHGRSVGDICVFGFAKVVLQEKKTSETVMEIDCDS
jgi:hypothetical protein